MLVQLVCLDRRYQRMNCYNIREIQTILKSKYTPSSVDASDVRFSLNDTTIGLRYQLGELDFINNSTLMFYQHTLSSNSPFEAMHTFLNKPLSEFNTIRIFMDKSSLMYNSVKSVQLSLNLHDDLLTQSPLSFNTSFSVGSRLVFSEVVSSLQLIFCSFSLPFAITSTESADFDFKLPLSSMFSKFELASFFNYSTILDVNSLIALECNTYSRQLYSNLMLGQGMGLTESPLTYYPLEQVYVSHGAQLDSNISPSLNLFQENSSDYRFLRLVNPVFKYDFKVGNYMSDDNKKMNPHLFRTIQDLTTGVRKSS